MNSIFRTGVTGFNLDNFVPAPEPDTFPRPFLDTGYYTIEFHWFDVTDLDPKNHKELLSPAKFGPGRRYRAELTIRSNSNFSFENPSEDAKEFSWGKETNSPNKGKGEIKSAAPAGIDTIKITIDFEKTGKIKINLLNFYGIKAPANDGTPIGSLEARTGYKIYKIDDKEINWFDDDNGNALDGKFKADGNYRAKVTVKAEPKYTFEGLEKSGILHTGKDVSLDPEIPPEDCDTLTVTIVFHPAGITGISHINLKDIPGPVAGENADTDYSTPEGAGYDVTDVAWSNDGKEFNLKPPFEFTTGQKYWSRITVTPHEGYQFANLDNLKDLEDRVTHNGEKVTTVLANDGKSSIYIIVEYDEITTLVTKVDLKGIPAPNTGKAPVTKLDTPGLPFTVESITWRPADTAFQVKAYEAVVKLKTKAWYFFDNLKASGISHNGNLVKMDPDSPGTDTTSITVTINFDPPVPETNQDTDGDGLTDEEEAFYRTLANNPDTDGDGFPDGWEVANGANGADPLDRTKPGPDADPDKDGFPNGWETENGHDPFNPGDPLPGDDEDDDGFPNGWEVDNGYDPLNKTDPNPNGDDDKDGLTNREEFEERTNPKNPDTDGDGFSDWWEVDHGCNPLGPEDPLPGADEDGDGFPNDWEVDNGYNPLNQGDPNPDRDDDEDGFTNQEEFNNETDPHVWSKKTITAFSITAPVTAAGVINQTERTITVTVPHGTAVTNMTASATHLGKSISPTPGTGRSYTDPVPYTVTALDNTTQNYTVTVVQEGDPGPVKSNAASITGFRVAGVNGSIGTNSIDVTLPYGASLTSLAPVITVSPGATVSPASETPRDFTSPVTYTVTAQDGTTKKTYTATVKAAKNSEAKITGFSLAGVTVPNPGVSINVTVPYGTDLTNLTPTINLSPGATVSPASGTAQDFTNSVTYTVTAQDGTTKKAYTVTVTDGKNTAALISDFSVSGQTGTSVIDHNAGTISFTVPYGTAVNNLSPTIIVSPGATVSPASGTERDFSSPQTYTVTAEDETTTKIYTVTGTVTQNNEALISSFSVPGQTGTSVIDHNAGTISFTVPYGTAVNNLSPTIIVSPGATVSPASGTACNFSSPVNYRVTAENGSTKDYTVTVQVAPNPAKDITAFAITSPVSAEGIISGTNITLTVPYGTARNSMSVSVTHTGAKVTDQSNTQQTGSPAAFTGQNLNSSRTYRVTAENGSTKDYTVTVNVALNTAKDITAFLITAPVNGAGVINGTDITFTVPQSYGASRGSMDVSITHTGVKITGPNSIERTANPGVFTGQNLSSPKTYRVTAEDGSTKDYTVTVQVAAAASLGAAFKITVNSGADSSFILPIRGTTNDLFIEWGDGSQPHIILSSVNGISHTYPAANTNYQISIYGTSIVEPNTEDICGFGFTLFGYAYNQAANKAKLISLDSSIASLIPAGKSYGREFLNAAFRGCTGLTSISGDFLSGVTNNPDNGFLSNAFRDCTALTSIPAGFWTRGSPSGTFNFFSSTFRGCTALTSIPDDFLINASGGQGISFLNYTFEGCTALTTIPEKFLKRVSASHWTFMRGTFQGCTALTSASPIDDAGVKLYTKGAGGEAGGGGSNHCFAGCTQMADYAEIPDAWK